MKVVSVMNWKGGVGKTTLTYHLGAGLAKFLSKRVLMIDCDAQCNLSFLAMGPERYFKHIGNPSNQSLFAAYKNFFKEKPTLRSDVVVEKKVKSKAGRVFNHVDLIPGHHDLVEVDIMLAKERKPFVRFRDEASRELEKLARISDLLAELEATKRYDYVLLDCPPSTNLVAQSAFFASDFFFVPVLPHAVSRSGLGRIVGEMKKLNETYAEQMHFLREGSDYRPTKFLGVVFNMVKHNGNQPIMGQQVVIQQTRDEIGDRLFEPYITGGDGLTAASEVSLPVYAFNDLPRARENASRQSEQLERVVREFARRVETV